MSDNVNGVSVKPPSVETVSEFFRRVGRGFRVWSKEKRSIKGKLAAPKQWATKRELYGPTGRKPRSYKLWREERGLPPVESTFET
jgi:hypothetical protein